MYCIRNRLNLIVISLLLHLYSVRCDNPDICFRSGISAAEKVTFLDDIDRLFITSGGHYWFVNETSDRPTSDTALELPFGFAPDAALIKDTRRCPNGQFTLLLIQKKHITGSNEEEWLTMEYSIGEWNQNGTDPGVWNEPTRIARCSLDSKVCSTSDNYFATMNFDFKKPLDAAFGVIGQTAYFIQDELFYNVSYRTPCVQNPYREVIAQQPTPLKTRISAGFISDNQITLFDRDFYIDLTNSTNITLDVLRDEEWKLSPNNFFTECPQLTASLGSILSDIFTNSRNRLMNANLLIIIILVCFVVLIGICSFIVWLGLRRRTMKVSSNAENGDGNSDSPLHEEHLLKSDSPKVTNDSNDKGSPNQNTVES